MLLKQKFTNIGDNTIAIEFLDDMLASKLPGVGEATAERLKSNGISNCKEMRENFTLQQLQSICGNKTGQRLFDFCRGIDKRALSLSHVSCINYLTNILYANIYKSY